MIPAAAAGIAGGAGCGITPAAPWAVWLIGRKAAAGVPSYRFSKFNHQKGL